MNNLLEKKTYYQMLFNFYGNLLTEKQKELFIAYYENDFSLHEIAEEFGISRNAVHDALKNAVKNLEHFEELH
jgi:RNA polymerase sigma factor (sigma-70 family)